MRAPTTCEGCGVLLHQGETVAPVFVVAPNAEPVLAFYGHPMCAELFKAGAIKGGGPRSAAKRAPQRPPPMRVHTKTRRRHPNRHH